MDHKNEFYFKLIIWYLSFIDHYKMSNCNPLAKILDTNRLTGPKFDNWLWNLKIILTF